MDQASWFTGIYVYKESPIGDRVGRLQSWIRTPTVGREGVLLAWPCIYAHIKETFPNRTLEPNAKKETP
ncbi:hypothetical protein GOBAR_AA35330 [Gossypium barbadense]|uniref:Uncharacterized protein n=1 Tax=Gossypium barbadense TaxID=3634 RepID=A0A2P5W2Q5_GOSBA|nr:hypothetical protein GOBAR_AA35330 [Gossypium barbadense]